MKKHTFVIGLMLVGISVYSNDSLHDWNILDRNGNIVHVIKNAKQVAFFNGEIFIVEYEDGFVFLDKDFSEILRGSFDLECTGLFYDRIGYYDPTLKKYGYLNGEGEVIIEPRFDYVEGFVHGHAVVGFRDTSGPRPPRLTYRIIDTSGKYTNPNEFGFVELPDLAPNKALVSVKGKGKVCRFIQFDGSTWKPISTQKEFDFLKAAGNFVIYSTEHERGFGFVNWDDEILMEPIYDAVFSTYGGRAIVSMRENWRFVVDRFGNSIEIEVEGTMLHVFGDRYVTFLDDGKTGVYDYITKEVIIPPIYKNILIYNEGIFVVNDEIGKKGFVNVQGDIIAEPIYDRVMAFFNGFGMGIKY